MDRLEAQNIVAKIEYKDWKFAIPGDYLRVEFYEDGELQKGRKWKLSPFMTKSEIVQTALVAVLYAEEHEVRERFRYNGAKIFGPHFDVDKLAEFAKKRENLDIREEFAGV